jgi:hypothetical protein
MMRFLKRPNGKPPAAPEKPAATRRDEFANAVAALRKATGTTESRIVPCRCAKTSLPFSLRFERLSPAHRFQIARIDKDDEPGAPVKEGFGLFGRKPAQQAYDAGEFDWTGSFCPHCGDRSIFVFCDTCGDTVCGGRVRSLPDGGRTFACHDGCGATGGIGPATHVHGGAAAGSFMPEMKRLTGPAAKALLPGSAYPRMHRPKAR